MTGLSVRKTEQITQDLFHFSTQLKYTLANLNDTHLRRGLFKFFGGGAKTQELKIELNAILCGLIPSFQNIENHTMSDINRIIEVQNLGNRLGGTTFGYDGDQM